MHLLNRTAPNHAAPLDQELGMIAMPAVVAELAAIKKAFISGRPPPLKTDDDDDELGAKSSIPHHKRSP